MTPTQLRAYAALVRLGSFKSAAEELAVSESAISFHIGQLRKELGDQLVARQASGLAFTPGGLRLASRAIEMLGLQDRTIAEVTQAASGRRLLRIAASSLFGEFAAPGLIEMFASRAKDVDVELSLHRPGSFTDLLLSRSVDVAIGPRPAQLPPSLVSEPFLRYQYSIVTAPAHSLAGRRVAPSALRAQTWFLGPSAAAGAGLVPELLRTVGVPDTHQRIFQNHTAATDEVKHTHGIAPALSFAVAKDVASGALGVVEIEGVALGASWELLRVAPVGPALPGSPIDELARFLKTPKAIQAMIRGAGVTSGRFRPSIHVTLWS